MRTQFIVSYWTALHLTTTRWMATRKWRRYTHNERIEALVRAKKEAKKYTYARMNGRRRTKKTAPNRSAIATYRSSNVHLLAVKRNRYRSMKCVRVCFWSFCGFPPKIKCILFAAATSLPLYIFCSHFVYDVLIHRLFIIIFRQTVKHFFGRFLCCASSVTCFFLVHMDSKMCVWYVNMLTTALKCQPAVSNSNNNERLTEKFGQISAYVHRPMLFSVLNRRECFFFRCLLFRLFKMHLNATSQNVQW